MAGPAKDEKEKLAPIIIKRIKKGGGGHHGGAWKVAYADFVTAMMAFFLLLWLLNVTTEEQKNAISNYFDPSHPKISDVTSGAGGILAGLTMAPDGAMVSTVQPISQPEVPDTSTRGIDDKIDLSEQQLEEELRKKEDERFKAAEDKLKAEIANSAELKNLAGNLLIDITPEGLRIQIVDDKGRSMFPSGSAAMYDFMRQLLLKVTGVIKPLPNQVSVRGHTDSQKYRDPSAYDNWNLSADRAQASRRVMVEGGLPEKRIENVMGRADREHLDLKDPSSPRNRRISIILLRERLTRKPDDKPKTPTTTPDASNKPAVPGLQIIDDTQPNSVASHSSDAKSTPVIDKGAMPGEGERPSTPLPVAPETSNFAKQPQVIYFGDESAPQPSGETLYEGPTQSPFVNKPPQITTPVFDLGEEKAAVPTKTMTFDDKPSPLAAPKTPAVLPAAPALQLVNPTDTPKVMEFNSTPALKVAPLPVPAQDMQLINPSTPTKVLDFGAAPPPAPVQSAPQQTPSTDADNKELTF